MADKKQPYDDLTPLPLRRVESKPRKALREYIEALFTAILLAFFIRSFIVEPFKIPSKSMVPTLLVGDYLFVNKFAYGLRVPWTKKWLLEFGDPKRGDVVVFIYPQNEKLDFIKRVVGVPGDHIRIHESRVYLNGKELSEQELKIAGVDPANRRELKLASTDIPADVPKSLLRLPFYREYEHFRIALEQIDEKRHLIQESRLMPLDEEVDIVVPEGKYWVMGDNRDQSSDSRVWGFVPRENLKGRAIFIWFSMDSDLGGVRLKRIGKKII